MSKRQQIDVQAAAIDMLSTQLPDVEFGYLRLTSLASLHLFAHVVGRPK